MRAAVKTAVAAAIALLGAAGAAEACNRATVSGGNQLVDPSRINQAMIDKSIRLELNYQRCQLGLKPLGREPRLQKVAAGHAKWMAGAKRLSHTSTQPGKRSVRARILKAKLGAKRGSENILSTALYQTEGPRGYRIVNAQKCQFATASGKPIARHSYNSLARYAVQLWMNSPSHRVNIVDRKVKVIGSAAGFDPSTRNCGTIYLAQNFAG